MHDILWNGFCEDCGNALPVSGMPWGNNSHDTRRSSQASKKIKNDERFYYPNTDAGRQAYLDDSEAYCVSLKAQLPNYFGILPKGDLEVRRLEPFKEQDGEA